MGLLVITVTNCLWWGSVRVIGVHSHYLLMMIGVSVGLLVITVTVCLWLGYGLLLGSIVTICIWWWGYGSGYWWSQSLSVCDGGCGWGYWWSQSLSVYDDGVKGWVIGDQSHYLFMMIGVRMGSLVITITICLWLGYGFCYWWSQSLSVYDDGGTGLGYWLAQSLSV